MSPSHCLHIDLDGAWPRDSTTAESYVDCRAWGPRLRYSTSRREIEAFHTFLGAREEKFTLFGSGDFHHLTALWLRRIREPFTLLSFDNHPDWDIRPPRWCCGTWLNRALELPALRKAAIWGCGNFELNWPGYLFISRRALRTGRLAVWPWSERLGASGRKRWPGIERGSWQAAFSGFARQLAGQRVYVTVDLDSLEPGAAVTNWENGMFTAADIAWALGEIRTHTAVIGGDLCGPYTEPRYARWTQRFAANRDHPKLPAADQRASAECNQRAFRIIWKALTAG